jgi:RNHCP domain
LRTIRKKHFLLEEDEQDSTRSRYGHKQRRASEENTFKCKQCRRFIGALPSGGHHRNHCPFCLYSLHVDDRRTGDRQSTCRSRMQPIGSFQRRNGEHVLVHQCLGCGFERFNRIAADDDFELVLSLPSLPPRTTGGKQRLLWEHNSQGLQEADLDMIFD